MNHKKISNLLFKFIKYFLSGLLILCFLVYSYIYLKADDDTRMDRQKRAFYGLLMFLYYLPAIIVYLIMSLYDYIKNFFSKDHK